LSKGFAHDFSIAQRRVLGLDLRLDLVVPLEQLVADDRADARVPVHERAIAVERRPALHGGEPSYAARRFGTRYASSSGPCSASQPRSSLYDGRAAATTSQNSR